MLPGLGDGLTTVKRMALPMSMLYRMYANDYNVFIFSRKNDLEEGYSTRDMARDQAEAMKMLGIKSANILGISQGGMIAQYLAIDYPDLVEKLVLAVTLSKQNKRIQNVVGNWISMAEHNDYKKLMIDTVERFYSERHFVERIKFCEEYIYTRFGHAAYEEAKDFNGRILKFLSSFPKQNGDFRVSSPV